MGRLRDSEEGSITGIIGHFARSGARLKTRQSGVAPLEIWPETGFSRVVSYTWSQQE